MPPAPSSKPPIIIEQPLINSIPPELEAHFDPVFVEYYCKYNAGRIATHQIPIEHYRRDPLKYTTAYGREIVDTGSLIITEEKCPVEDGEITIRIFQPAPVSTGQKPRPVYVNYHGGGWVFGGLANDEDFCKRLAHETGCVAFDVDYRLSPEYKFPVPVDDSWAALNWVRNEKATEYNLDLDKVAIGGASAGGHLAAVVAHMCREEGTPLAFQLLGVPVCDLHVFTPTGQLRPDCPYESQRALYHTQPLSSERMQYFHGHFLGDPRPAELENSWKVSPIKAPSFAGLAPALILTAEMDLLRDEGEAYGRKMNEAGSKAEVIRVKGVPHNFMQMDAILEGGKQYNREAVRALREIFGH
ncbi:putative Esterase [Seiridium cardinale]|uniref:Esterase n=1 Tax=Seiridium cardinale TaxID=138064 RepID=A0ABR2XPA6_9PEZI